MFKKKNTCFVVCKHREFAECLHDMQKYSLEELFNFSPVKLNFCFNDLPACICF